MSIDSHAHIFLQHSAMAADRRYTPHEDAPLAAYLAMLDANGSTHGVLVQPSFLGTDNSFLLSALDEQPGRLKGIVVVPVDTARATMRSMQGRGAVGVRLNLIGEPDPDLFSAVWRRHLDDLAALDWQVEVQVEAKRLEHLLPWIIKAGVRVVVDHFGRPDKALGINDPGFRYLLEAGQTRLVWVKLSAPYRLAAEPHGDEVALAAAPLLLKAYGPDRLVWGSDWPHTEFETVANPRWARLALDQWAPNPTDRQAILSSTPAELFGFRRRFAMRKQGLAG